MKENDPNRRIRIGKARPPRDRKGFTLVELLVVIAIIAVLALLSFVGFSKMRGKARGVTCASNLRQIGSAMIAHAGENNGQLPPLEDRSASEDKLKGIWTQIIADGGHIRKSVNWDGLEGCNANVWACPECTTRHRYFNGYGASEGAIMRKKLASVPGSGSLRLSQINRPERTWLVGDALNAAGDLKSGWYAVWSNPVQWNAHAPCPRHNGKVNVCMVDGNVRQMTVQELRDGKHTLNE